MDAVALDGLVAGLVGGAGGAAGAWAAVWVHLGYHRRDITRAQATADAAHRRLDGLRGYTIHAPRPARGAPGSECAP